MGKSETVDFSETIAAGDLKVGRCRLRRHVSNVGQGHFFTIYFPGFILLVQFVLLSGHLLGNSCPLGWQFVLLVFCLFVIFIYFPLWFWGRGLPFDCSSSCSLLFYYFYLYFLCFTRPRYQVSVYRTIGPLVTRII